MRFGAARGAWRSCRAIASTAVNVACAVLLAITPPRPELALMTARICLKLRRPRRAYDALAAVNAIDVRQIADSDRTAEQITNIAAVLCAQRLRAEAKDVLRSTIALAPRAAAPGPRLSCCWKRTFAPPAATYRWSNGRNSRTFCENPVPAPAIRGGRKNDRGAACHRS